MASTGITTGEVAPRSHASTAARALRIRLLRIPEEDVTLAARGFTAAPADRERLELHAGSFREGFTAAVAADGTDELLDGLASVDSAERGFAFEGAAMGCALLDLLALARGTRLRRLVATPAGERHVYMLHVGAGWALARLRLNPGRMLPGFDGLLRWLAADGYGFHQGFFAPERHLRSPHRRWSAYPAYALRAFDQGLGRSLWFADGADPERVAATLAAIPEDRRADLWSGVGLAAAYAGAAEDDAYPLLRRLAAGYVPELAQGAAFAAAARLRAGNVVEHTDAACAVLCGVGVQEAAEITSAARRGLEPDSDGRSYERWRERIRARLAGRGT